MASDADPDEYLNTDIEAEQATGVAAANLLRPVAAVLMDAPPGKRYDVAVEIREHDAGGEDGNHD